MAGMIPQSFIDDLLARADVVDVVDKRIKLRKTGKNYQALCPFHQEKSPSFSVEPDKQFYYCFGCGAGGNALGFIMNYDNVDFPQAVEILAAENGMEVPRESGPESSKQKQQKSEQTVLLELLARTSKFYQFQLRQHPARQQAVDYLQSRGLSGAIAREYQLGFAPPGWDNLLTAIGTTAEDCKLLEKAGLVIRKDSARDANQENEPVAEPASGRQFYDRFRHRIMFPIRNTKGQVIGFGGRVLGDDKPKYLNSPETPIYHKGSELYGLYEAKQTAGKLEQIIIVEGYLDVIALAQSGIHNAVATLGTATSNSHLTRLFRLVSDVVFCFDGDDAGRAAAWRALQVALPLVEDGRHLRFLFLAQGEDPDSLVRKVGKEQFLGLINKAMPLEDFLFNKLSQGLDLNAIEDKARLGKLAKPLLAQFPKGIYRQLMMDRLSQLVGMDSNALNRLLSGIPDEPPEIPDYARAPAYGSPKQAAVPARYRKPWSLKAIELLLSYPGIASGSDQDLTALKDADGETSRMLLSLVELARQNPHIETYTLLGYCYGTPVGYQLTQLMREEKITPIEGARDEFWQILESKLTTFQQKAEVERKLQPLKDKLGAGTGENPV